MTGLIDLLADVELATHYPVPVLITAPRDHAFAVALAIASGGKEKRKPPNVAMFDVAMFDGTAIVRAALDRRANERTSDEEVLVIREVQALNSAEQAALMRLLDDEEARERRRIIATSSVCLFDRVGQGTFDARLFYRLNAIHIMSQCSDRATISRPCCSGAAADSSWLPHETRF